MIHGDNLSLIDIQGEEWRNVKDFEDFYMVSNFGRVKSLKRIVDRRVYGPLLVKEKIIRQDDPHSYRMAEFNIKGVRKRETVHRLVLKTFKSNPENKPCVNHINGVKWDNRLENLEWVTEKENAAHAAKLGLLRTGEKNNQTTISNSDVVDIFYSESRNIDIAKKYGISKKTVSQIKNKRTRLSQTFKL